MHAEYRNRVGTETKFGSARWARLALALINTAPAPRHGDLLTRPEHLRALLLLHDEPEPVIVTDVDLADARAARSALEAVFAVLDDDLQVAHRLNQLLAQTARPRLASHDGTPLHLHIDSPDSSWGGWLAASGAMALALLITEHGVGVLSHCAASDCSHALLRVGAGPLRRYCSSTCANRARVAAHRAAKRAGTSG